MKKWQRAWLYFLILYSLLHLLRDILQDLNIITFLSTILIKPTSASTIYSSFLGKYSTYLIAIIELALATIILKKNNFGKLGYVTIIIAAVTALSWLNYWFFTN